MTKSNLMDQGGVQESAVGKATLVTLEQQVLGHYLRQTS